MARIDRAAELARSLKVTRGRKLRVDAIVVETNVHHPTDSALLGDGVRVLSRLLRRARKVLPSEEIDRLGKEIFRTRNRSPQHEADCPNTSDTAGSMSAKELKSAARSASRVFSP
jgi:hypothetical protein